VHVDYEAKPYLVLRNACPESCRILSTPIRCLFLAVLFTVSIVSPSTLGVNSLGSGSSQPVTVIPTFITTVHTATTIASTFTGIHTVVTMIPSFTSLHVHAIVTAYDDGSDAANIDAKGIQQMLNPANQAYVKAGILFVFDASELEVVKKTELKVDLPSGKQEVGLPQGFSKARTDRANSYPGKIVIYFRNWKDGDPRYDVPNFSSSLGNYIVLTPDSTDPVFMHEVGHYLGLDHPFGGHHDEIYARNSMAERLALARRLIKSAVEVDGVPIADALRIFDGDLPRVTDTPPDEPALFGEGLPGLDLCSSPVSVTLDVMIRDKQGNQVTGHYVLQPDKGNVMSYYFRCPGPKYISPGQASIVRDVLLNGNRHHLIAH
jgi:hypothetical protein